jgi:hypothetical protein
VKKLLTGYFAVAVALTTLSATSNAQTVKVNGLGSSALFLELGLAAASPAVGASCVWSTNTSGTVVATDSSLGSTNLKTDTGNAFVAWTPVGGSCTTITSATQIYAYLQTDSVVGDRCLFNACTIQNNGSGLSPAGLINSSEISLPSAIATTLNGAAGTGLAVNAAGTDIRPEDAEFAMTRALTPCGTPVATGSQYLGLGYSSDGSTPVQSHFSGSTFNVLPFTLPSSYSVTPIGAAPILVVVNGDGTANGFSNSSITDISSSALSSFLDGTFSFTNQALSTPVASGAAATVIIREPLSGTYNTMEYNAPNTTTLQTSQDVGVNQPVGQSNCNGAGNVASNAMNIATASGGARQRAIGTGQELNEVLATQNSLGYAFWSVANFKGFTSAAAPNAKYLTVDGIEPLLKPSSSHTGIIPITGTTEMSDVTLANVANGTYPIWSLLRLVNLGSSPLSGVTSLANAAHAFVSTGSTTSRPDFVPSNQMTVVRSHFMPPAGAGEPTAIANGHVGTNSSACIAPELGGDVGGQVFTLSADSTFCTNNGVTTGQTGLRR